MCASYSLDDKDSGEIRNEVDEAVPKFITSKSSITIP